MLIVAFSGVMLLGFALIVKSQLTLEDKIAALRQDVNKILYEEYSSLSDRSFRVGMRVKALEDAKNKTKTSSVKKPIKKGKKA